MRQAGAPFSGARRRTESKDDTGIWHPSTVLRMRLGCGFRTLSEARVFLGRVRRGRLRSQKALPPRPRQTATVRGCRAGERLRRSVAGPPIKILDGPAGAGAQDVRFLFWAALAKTLGHPERSPEHRPELVEGRSEGRTRRVDSRLCQKASSRLN